MADRVTLEFEAVDEKAVSAEASDIADKVQDVVRERDATNQRKCASLSALANIIVWVLSSSPVTARPTLLGYFMECLAREQWSLHAKEMPTEGSA